MATTNVTIATGKKLYVSDGNGGAREYVATNTVDLPSHEAKRLVAQGIAANT